MTPRRSEADELPLTPEQTSGPFYPIPPIVEQRYNDSDLTRLKEDSPVAEGELLIVSGQVRDLSGELVPDAVVEIWQTCHSGRYQHQDDRNTAPLDPNFQYWGRAKVDEKGMYEFLTIRPGKYPGRTLHIHYQIVAPDRKPLVTQLYFEDRGALNAEDGIYKSLSRAEQSLVTIPFAAATGELPRGRFDIVMGPRGAKGTTPVQP
jgi:protocatechuate 3,4-dioxygenase beta subunit